MIIVGLAGGIGHGKTTLAEYLALNAHTYRHWETSDIVIEVANAIRNEHAVHPRPDSIADMNDWLAPLADVIYACVHAQSTPSQLAITERRVHSDPDLYAKLLEYLRLMQDRPELQSLEITRANKALFRSLLQWLGGYLVKSVDNGIWYNELVRRIHMQATKGIDLVTVGGVRFPGDAERLRNAGGFIVAIERPGQTNIDSHDVTERERSQIKPDTKVINNSDLIHLKQLADRLYSDLEVRNLKPQYIAAGS